MTDVTPAENGQLMLPLSDNDAATRTTRAIALASSLPKGPSRRQRILDIVSASGSHGCTGDEISEAMDTPIHALTSPIQLLVKSGRLLRTSRTRLTRLGSPAVVMVTANRAGG